MRRNYLAALIKFRSEILCIVLRGGGHFIMKFENLWRKQQTNELYNSINLSAIANNYQTFGKFYILQEKNIYIFFNYFIKSLFVIYLQQQIFLMFLPFVCQFLKSRNFWYINVLVRNRFNLSAPCVLYIGQAFRYSPENTCYIFTQQIYFIV